jgi:Winged helix DNA-binding domain
MAAERVLTRRELNRALLARQLLLERSSLTATKAAERLGGLQAQSTASPYLSLHARLEGFEREQLTKALKSRRLVKALLQRGTLHVVAPRHYWAVMAIRREFASALWPPAYEARITSKEIERLGRKVLKELGEGEISLKEAQGLLAPHVREGVPATFLWRRIQSYAHVVHVAPSGVWGYGGHGVYAAAEGRLSGEAPSLADAFDELVTTYLRAYGPATPHDLGQWAGIPRVQPIRESFERLSLRTFRSESGKVLHDVPRAPLPDAETPAPARLAPRFDNLVLSHADRTRILGDVAPSRIVTNNAVVHATILVDGFVAGTWQLEKGRVKLEPWGRLDQAAKRALKDEVARVEEFAAQK